MTRFRECVAAERIPYGAPVKITGAECRSCPNLAVMDGVASRNGGMEDAINPGDRVKVKTDGGILIALSADAEATINGVRTRLLAADSNYVTLQDGKIVA